MPGHWVSLGSDSVIPYDDGVIGKGELEGGQHEKADPLLRSDPNFSLEDRMAGQCAKALADAVESATPVKRENFGRD